jgi:hypothetical protein
MQDGTPAQVCRHLNAIERFEDSLSLCAAGAGRREGSVLAHEESLGDGARGRGSGDTLDMERPQYGTVILFTAIPERSRPLAQLRVRKSEP